MKSCELSWGTIFFWLLRRWSCVTEFSVVLSVASSATHPCVYSLSSSASSSFSSTLVSLGATVPKKAVAHKLCFLRKPRLRQLSSFCMTCRPQRFAGADFIMIPSLYGINVLYLSEYNMEYFFLPSSPWILELSSQRVSVTLYISVVLVCLFEQYLMSEFVYMNLMKIPLIYKAKCPE